VPHRRLPVRYTGEVASFLPLVSPPVDAGPTGRWYLVRAAEILVDEAGALPAPGSGPDELGFGSGDLPATEDPVLLGQLDGELCWAAGVAAGAPAPAGHRWAPLLGLGGSWAKEGWMLAGRAVQLVEWRRTSRHCGRCGTATEVAAGERALRCPACGLLAYPRLAPAVIVLVRKGDRALLAAGRGFRGGMYSALAGFVEPGESLEEAVAREVGEEVGVRLKDIRYVGSQPWPFPHSLMVGFRAEWDGGEIEPDGTEILDAAWWSVDDLPPIPPSVSIARTLIDQWVAEVGAAGLTPGSPT
jgi:NAD+ diphosphatase